MYRRKKRLKKRVKRFLIVAAPIIILCSLSYVSISYLSQASETKVTSEHYYEDPSYTKDDTEYDSTDNDQTDVTDMEDAETKDDTQDITNHDDVILDTNPESITVLVNKELSLPSDYIPSDLVVPNVSYSFDYYDEKKLMRKEAADALEELFQGAQADGFSLRGVSAYRSYDRQYEIFTNNVKKLGFDHTVKYSAIPGYSEHQTGLAIDVSSKAVNYRLDASFGSTKESDWLTKNAHLYGYIIRYAQDKTAITGYSYEPWHIRYVGKELAAYLYENNLALEEYYNFVPSEDYTDAISYDNLVDYGIDPDDLKVPTKAPTPTPTPSPSPTPTPTETPTPSVSPTPTELPEDSPEVTGTIPPTITEVPEDDNTGVSDDNNEEQNNGNNDNESGEVSGTITPTITPAGTSMGQTVATPPVNNTLETIPTPTPTPVLQ